MDPLKYIIPGRKRLPYGMMNFAISAKTIIIM